MNTKSRRHSGRVKENIWHPEKYPEVPAEYWDNWVDHRDGYRWDKDRTHIRNTRSIPGGDIEKENNRLKKLIVRRKKMKFKDGMKRILSEISNC